MSDNLHCYRVELVKFNVYFRFNWQFCFIDQFFSCKFSFACFVTKLPVLSQRIGDFVCIVTFSFNKTNKEMVAFAEMVIRKCDYKDFVLRLQRLH